MKKLLIWLGFYEEGGHEGTSEELRNEDETETPVDESLSRFIQLAIDMPVVIAAAKTMSLKIFVLLFNSMSLFWAVLRRG